MSSNSRLFVKPFIGGINTELSSVEDAILNTSDELNCTILPEGIRGRRLGFNIERDGKWFESNESTISSVFYWNGVGKKDLDYIVVQRGTTLYFFANSSFKDSGLSIDLVPYVVSSETNHLRYATCAGDLIVVGDWIDPIKISWDYDKLSLNVIKVNIKWRDLIGIDDGLKIDETPSELTPEHKYNLYNQGWSKYIYTGDDGTVRKIALDAFHDEVGYYPSNSMLHYLDKAADSSYDTFEILKHFYGDTPAPKGHYILDYFSRSRSKASGISLTPSEDTHSYFKNGFCIAKNGYVQVNNFVSNRWNYAHEYFPDWSNPEFIINIKQSGKVSSVNIQLYEFVTPPPQYKLADKQTGDKRYDKGIERYTLSLYGRTEDKEQLLKTETYSMPTTGGYGDTPIMSGVWTFDEPQTYDQYYFKLRFLGIQKDTHITFYPWMRLDTDFIFTENDLPSNEVVGERITDITSLGGRYFYLAGDTVLFSQVLKDDGTGFDACHQEADPTSEEINDVVATDGGYVKFPTMGKGLSIESFNRGVIVFGKSNVYGIISPMEQVLTATSYDVVELSKAGLIGSGSVVSTSDKIFYWSPLGIFQIGLHAETGNTVVAQSISINTIQEMYNNIPTFSKEHCIGSYDYVNNRIYWYYPTSEAALYKLDGCLVFDLTYGSFMVFKIGDSTTDMPYISHVCKTPGVNEIKPTMYLRVNGDRVVANEQPVIAAEETSTYNRWTALKHLIRDENNSFSFGEYNSREFKDFDKHSYESYMVSRPIMFTGFSTFGNVVQDTANDKQVPILQTLFKRTEQNRLEPYKAPVKHVKSGEPVVTSFRTYARASADSIKGFIESVNVHVDLSKFEKSIWYIGLRVFGVDENGKRTTIANKSVNVFNKPIDTIDEILTTTDTISYVRYDLEVEVYHGSSDTTGAEQVSATFALTINTGTSVDRFKYIAESGANIRMRWGWSLTDRSNRWDMVQNGYRPQKDFLHDEYVESRIHVRGRGKAFQVEIRNNDNRDFRLAGMNLLVRSK